MDFFFSALAFSTLVLRLFKFKSALLSSCHLRSPFKVSNHEKILNYVQFTLPKLARWLTNQIPWIFPILTDVFNLVKETKIRGKHICFNNVRNSEEYTFFFFSYPEAKYVPLFDSKLDLTGVSQGTIAKVLAALIFWCKLCQTVWLFNDLKQQQQQQWILQISNNCIHFLHCLSPRSYLIKGQYKFC